ncbi:MAG: hypothetical protein RIQ79_1674 [Verrucomicrobiota bacterium]
MSRTTLQPARRLVRLLFILGAFMLPAALSTAATPPATWTTGHKKILIIPVRFTDLPGPSDTPSINGTLSGWGNVANGTMTAQMSAFMAKQSYGKCTLEFTLLPEIDLGVSYTTYLAPLNADSASSKFTRWYEPGSIMGDIRARARQIGLGTANPALYDTDNYDLDIAAVGFIPGQGEYAQGITYGKGMFAQVFNVLSHEIGHNLGLSHAWGGSRPTFYAPMIRNTYSENKYGNVFDLMGYKDYTVTPLPADREVGAYWKSALGWLPPTNVAFPSTSGTYRIHALDQGSLGAGQSHAMRITRDPTHTYWFEYRTSLTGPDAQWTQNGLLVTMGAECYESSAGDTYLLDMTPGSRGLKGGPFATMHDAPLALGRTYSDAEAGIHVTPITKGGTVPESLDVVVNLGSFPGNTAPTLTLSPASVTVVAGTPKTFTASAADANGDTLAYAWEFDDPDVVAGVATGGNNADTRLATQGTHTWTRAGSYLVRCTVTDMKGGKTTASSLVTITGGNAAQLYIGGIITDENGNPLAGAIVNNFSVADGVSYDSDGFAASGETAADGRYRIQLPYGAPGPHTYHLNVLYQGYSFTCSYQQGTIYEGKVPVYSASYPSVNFTRIRANRTLSGSITVAGRGYSPATDGPMNISVAGQTIAVSQGFWQVSIPDDTLVAPFATPGNPAVLLTPSNFPSPMRLTNDYNVFYFGVIIPGQMPETGFATAGATSDDTVGTVTIPMSMSLPSGLAVWPSQQDFFYSIDPSSTAEYGVDYKASGGIFTYFSNKVPLTKFFTLKILPTGLPKTKTIVLRLSKGNGVSNLGTVSTFTYTIHNPSPPPPDAAYLAWLATAFPGESDPAFIGDLADPDGDGAPNLLEFAFHGDPATPSSTGLTRHLMQDIDAAPGVEFTLVLAFRAGAVFTPQADGSQKNLAAIDSLHCTVQGSVNLLAYDQPVLHTGPSFVAPPDAGLPDLTGTGWEYHTFYLDPAVASERRFLRAVVDKQP